jgi:Flp pilus assembly protein TadD
MKRLLALLLPLLLVVVSCKKSAPPAAQDEFTRLTNLGKSQLEQGGAVKAVEFFQQALALNPAMPEAQLNLANAFLAANQSQAAIRQAAEILKADPDSAAALYIEGCAWMRLGDATNAMKAFQQSQRIDPAVTALNFQIALAHEQLGQMEEAVMQLQTAIEFEPEHPAAHYRLAQILLRLGRKEEADAELAKHKDILARRPNPASDPSVFEKCKHTLARLPFKLEHPATDGVKVLFTDTTKQFLPDAAKYRGPVAVIDLAHDGRNSLFVGEGEGFRLLVNSNGVFTATGVVLPGLAGARWTQSLAGDLQNDRTEDVVMIGDKGVQVFKFTTNGVVTETTRAAGFKDLIAADAALLDFDYTGKLGLLAMQPEGKGVRAFRNLGSTFSMYFSESGVTSGLPASVAGARQIALEDWNNDELMDVTIARDNASPLVLVRQRGGPFVETNLGATFPAASFIATGDLDGDMLPDFVGAVGERVELVLSAGRRHTSLISGDFRANRVLVLDYDNDGWLDIVAAGNGLRIWRNVGNNGFHDLTPALLPEPVSRGKVQFLSTADLDSDGDTDLILALEGGGLQFLRNDGGNTNHQLKLLLLGRRSNASGLGVRLEVSAGNLRVTRTVQRLPIEIGVGKRPMVDSVGVRWFDAVVNNDEIKVERDRPIVLEELERPTGSCPYLYAWDGKRFRFVTDLLGAAPIGLPVSDTRFVDADPFEYAHIGDESSFAPRDGRYVLQVTEELREVLYLDEAKLVIVDHPPGTEVHSTSKLVPGKPFPKHELVSLHRRMPLLKAINHESTDVTTLLGDIDQRMASPTKLRAPQMRGLAEPHSVTLDFGPLPVDRPLVLALTGWLRFGGGMANVSASHDPSLPFPFPILELEQPDGSWTKMDVTVGAPAGKTKTIVVDLAGKLPPGSRRLRLSAAFELHWDRIALFERSDNAGTHLTTLAPTRTDLHGRGYSAFEPLPWFLPLTPNYTNLLTFAPWSITPSGWATRYGAVDDLISAQDNALALVAGGDELTLEFAATALPPKPPVAKRDFFFYTVGWDKDADFHCELGWQIEPLPWVGIDSQNYGREARPAFPRDELMRQRNTRWVGPRTVVKQAR